MSDCPSWRQQFVERSTFLKAVGDGIMGASIPSDLVPFVQRMLSGRRFLSEDDVLAEGLRLLQARETLREEVASGFEQLDSGHGISADEAYSRAERRIDQIERGEV
jgi:antitoxin ParD1/3/4